MSGRRSYNAWMSRTLLLPLVLNLVVGCTIPGLTESLATKTLREIDHAMDTLSNESADWRATLMTLEGKLTDDAQSTIRNEIHNTLLRAEAAAGTQVKCIIDFTRARVIEDLLEIKKQIQSALGGTPIQVTRRPKLCSVVPDAIRMELNPNQRDVITFDGYNFDSPAPIKVSLNSRWNGHIVSEDVTRHLAKQTHYHMTLNLGSNGIQLTPDSESIVLTFDGGESTISVIQPQKPACQTQIDEYNLSSITYMPPWDSSTGDREFFGKVDIWTNVSLAMENGSLVVRVYMKAEQYDDDHTRAEGTGVFATQYTIPAGWRYDSILTPTVADHYHRGDKTWEDDIFGAEGLVRQYTFVGDTPTEEAGLRTQVTADFNPVRIRRVQVDNCAL